MPLDSRDLGLRNAQLGRELFLSQPGKPPSLGDSLAGQLAGKLVGIDPLGGLVPGFGGSSLQHLRPNEPFVLLDRYQDVGRPAMPLHIGVSAEMA